ncbi:MAG TPA: hypothetical protein VHM23_02100 [Actinomycetota bacterium]|nr:hypothetical protein [Actinomycetota bacterium]
MRPVRVIVTALLTASLAVAACSRSQPDQPRPTADQPPATTTAAAPKAPTPSSGSPDDQPVVLGDGRHPVLITTVDPDGHAITFDLIQFYWDDDATREAAKDHQESPPPNDYYIRNINPRLRTLPVARDAVITTNTLTAGYTGSATKTITVPLDRLRIVLLDRQSPPFWVTVRHGQVVKLAEQYLP